MTYELIVCTSERGGSGVSTLAQSIAVAYIYDTDKRVLLLDASRFPTAGDWAACRAQSPMPQLQVVQAPHAVSLEATLDACNGEFDLVVIDTGMQPSKVFDFLVERATVLIVPLMQSEVQVEAAMHLDRFGRRGLAMGLSKTAFVLNQAPLNSQANIRRVLMESFGSAVSICKTTIADRIVYQEVQRQGATVLDMRDPADAAAAAELKDLCRELFGVAVVKSG